MSLQPLHVIYTVDREIFALKIFRVRNFRALKQCAKIYLREKLTTAALGSTCEGSTMESEPLWLTSISW